MTTDWTIQQIEQLIQKSQDYKEKALLESVKKALFEQEKRREQNQGELDGTLWSPGEWNNP
ncbi:MAG TPA: hypothetical protein VK107_04055 [Alloiococcus sp.]|nr:hypothetical protein [Alloiococcus sp.]